MQEAFARAQVELPGVVASADGFAAALERVCARLGAQATELPKAGLAEVLLVVGLAEGDATAGAVFESTLLDVVSPE